MSSFFKDEQPLPPKAAGAFVSRLGPAVGSEGTSRSEGISTLESVLSLADLPSEKPNFRARIWLSQAHRVLQ